LPEFLQQQLAPKKGVIVEVPSDLSVYENIVSDFSSEEDRLHYLSEKRSYSLADGVVVGEHQGAHYFTRGQRKGLAVGGTKEPLFVIETNVNDNVIYTGQGKEHPGLYRRGLFVKKDEVHWVREDLRLAENDTMEVMARIRYRQSLEKAILHQTVSGLYVIFDNPQSAITAGQFVAWYQDDELLGSGVIS
jgi:tRNA-specific 2-thiouridylase